ncbi:hypothetical protein HDE76_003848 [Rhodanobacter sp. ANJX3]|uniref:hypothetical protein n=1 Tax=Rhodanobacter sp. ANJX3 TaxID=2723083 RepID=UPI001612AD73|nr:hypothetical protein [Rhodanobacter sp. ANJX3]MBB5360603.1 hypothetical protein [Rhodanobacter sp. ANJX3]
MAANTPDPQDYTPIAAGESVNTSPTGVPSTVDPTAVKNNAYGFFWRPVLTLFLAISTASYGATFKTQVDNDGPICTTFLEDLKAVHIERMTDAQLCDLDLSKIMRGFDFPTWQRHPEMDGIATLEKIQKASLLPNPSSDWSKSWPQNIDYAKDLDRKHKLYVESSKLTQLGTDVHVLQVEVDGCYFKWSKTSPEPLRLTPDLYALPEFSFELDPGPTRMLPFFMDPGYLSGTLANFGKGKRQILGLKLDHSWAVQDDGWKVLITQVTGFSFEVPKPDSTNHIDKEAGLKPYIYNFPICQFDIWVNAKELSHD